eukprot:1180408-Prorocentrum_minimum.AAC.3
MASAPDKGGGRSVTFKGQTWGDDHLIELRDNFSMFDTDADGAHSFSNLKMHAGGEIGFRNRVSCLAGTLTKHWILEEMTDEDQLYDALQLFDKERDCQINLAEVTYSIKQHLKCTTEHGAHRNSPIDASPRVLPF